MTSLNEIINGLQVDTKTKQNLTSFIAHLKLRQNSGTNKVLLLRGTSNDWQSCVLDKICKEYQTDDYCYLDIDELIKELRTLQNIGRPPAPDHPICIFGNLMRISSIEDTVKGKKFCLAKISDMSTKINDPVLLRALNIILQYTNIIVEANNIDKLKDKQNNVIDVVRMV